MLSGGVPQGGDQCILNNAGALLHQEYGNSHINTVGFNVRFDPRARRYWAVRAGLLNIKEHHLPARKVGDPRRLHSAHFGASGEQVVFRVVSGASIFQKNGVILQGAGGSGS